SGDGRCVTIVILEDVTQHLLKVSSGGGGGGW
ncbi:hypothetical protein A2U01_0082290, partial [Trifolium medium]|nr:hypothetical protein [Trifolium medium]